MAMDWSAIRWLNTRLPTGPSSRAAAAWRPLYRCGGGVRRGVAPGRDSRRSYEERKGGALSVAVTGRAAFRPLLWLPSRMATDWPAIRWLNTRLPTLSSFRV